MVRNGDNRKDLYQALWLLMASPDPERFHQHLQQILCMWKDKEQRFIAKVHTQTVQVIMLYGQRLYTLYY